MLANSGPRGYDGPNFPSRRHEAIPMQRRTFLQTAAAAIPAAAIPELLAAQSPAPPPAQAPALHVVGAGEDRTGHPHSLGFSTLLFKVSAADCDGRLFVIEHQHATPGSGPALHYHLNQEEWFYVMEGSVDFQVGDKRLRLGTGESVLAPRLVPHTFSPAGPGQARMLIAFTPAGKMEQYFIDAQSHNLAAEDPVAFNRRYDIEYVGPSPFWKA